MSKSAPIRFAPLLGLILAQPLFAQDVSKEEDSKLVLDLSLPPPRSTVDKECEDQADAARIAGEIIVCRELADVTDGAWNAKAWERDYARRTQGPKNPDVDGSGLILPSEGSIFMVTFTAKFGAVSEQPIIVDFEALPKAPSGSDADRMARGLPPLSGG